MSNTVVASSFSGQVVSGPVPERKVAFSLAWQCIEDLPQQYQVPILEKLQQIEYIAQDLLPLARKKQAAA